MRSTAIGRGMDGHTTRTGRCKWEKCENGNYVTLGFGLMFDGPRHGALLVASSGYLHPIILNV